MNNLVCQCNDILFQCYHLTIHLALLHYAKFLMALVQSKLLETPFTSTGAPVKYDTLPLGLRNPFCVCKL